MQRDSKGRIVVYGSGPLPSPVLLVGEAPGEEEAHRGRPFVGKSGREQDWYVSHNCRCGHHRRYHQLSDDARGRSTLGACSSPSCSCVTFRILVSSSWYKTNVVKEWRVGNPDPTPSQVREWGPVLEDEILRCSPRLIIAVGRFAARWLLGDAADMEAVHGLPHHAGAFDSSLSNRARGAIVLPIYHPATGLYDGSMRGLVDWDYEQVAGVLHALEVDEPVPVVNDLDTIGDNTHYSDVPGSIVGRWFDKYPPRVLGLDTEGTPTAPWSIQLSDHPGYGIMLRASRDDFAAGISALQAIIDSGTLLVMHNAPYDVEMCEAMGLDMRSARVWDSMDWAYLRLTEPQGLKPLAWRTCGMRMQSYSDLVGSAGVEKQLAYLADVEDGDWPKPEPRVIHENDGTSRAYQPQTVQSRAKKILLDYYTGKVDKDGVGVDPYKRWQQVDEELRAIVEGGEGLGPMPESTLDDVSLEEATQYACRDSDAALRIYLSAMGGEDRGEWEGLHQEAMDLFPVFYEMQKEGMPASVSHFERLRDDMTREMHQIGAGISSRFYHGRPFNPNSPPHVNRLLKRRGLKPEKTTKTGAPSTAKKSIEHLAYSDEAVKEIFAWRKRQHIRDSFCAPILARIVRGEGEDIGRVRCRIKTTRTAARRLAATDPNLLAIPVRDEMGRRVREGFVAPDGYVLGAWDLSGIEMRKAASLSGDPLMCRLFNEGGDLHSETVAAIFGIPRGQVDKNDLSTRIPAKTAGFGVLYGIQGAGLLDQLRSLGLEGWDEEACEDLIAKWLDTYGGVKEYIERTRREVTRDGVVYDEWGMPRRVPGIWHYKEHVAAEAARIAVSHRIQGGAQGMIRRSMRWLKERVRELQDAGFVVQWCLQVHDEVILLFEEDLWPVMDELVVEGLTQHHESDMVVPVEASGHKAKSWGELK